MVMSVPWYAPFGGTAELFFITHVAPRSLLPCSSASGCRVSSPSPTGASSTHPRPRTWALTQMNLSHKTAPTNLDRKRFFGLTRQIFIPSRRLMGRLTRPHCRLYTYMLRARQDTPGSGVPSASEIANLQATRIARNCFVATDRMFALPARYARTMHWTRPGALLSVASQALMLL